MVGRTPAFEAVVTEQTAHLRIDVFVVRVAAESELEPPRQLSRAQVQRWLADSFITVNAAPVRPSYRVAVGDIVRVVAPQPTPSCLIPEPGDLSILYEDTEILVIDKPRGLVVHPGAGHATGTLVHRLLFHCRDLAGIGDVLRPGIVHRLDSGTSGLMVIAKNDRAHAHLAAQFAARTIRKNYRAWVIGRPPGVSGTWATRYGRHPVHRKRFSSRVPAGKEAITNYRLVAHREGLSELELQLKTGRTHQLRVHCFDAGLPILGDPLYRGRAVRGLTTFFRDVEAGLGGHQALHAEELEFSHPTTEQRMVLRAPLPDELERLRRWVLFTEPVEKAT